jgi:hypothetical protein
MTDRDANDPDQSTSVNLYFVPGGTSTSPERAPAPSWLAAAADAVLLDMTPSKAPPLIVRYRPDPDLAQFGTVTFHSPTGQHFGFGVPENTGKAALLVSLADGLQEYLPETAGADGQIYPRCPGHLHAARPLLINSEAWWICPDTHRTLARIGQHAV